jgi:hypothetical protein
MISNRISNISSSKEVFDRATLLYNNALAASGYNEKIIFQKNLASTKLKSRSRNIIWFNPPFSQNVTTNIARNFLNLIEKHFPKSHKFRKIFNRNNLKVSYSCLPNITNIINSHNKKILSNISSQIAPTCNCRQITQCSLQGMCLSRNIIYICNVKTSTQDNGVNYIGLTEHTFKDRWYKHKNSFQYESKANSTELSKYIWEIKNKGFSNPTLTWKIIDKAEPFKPGKKLCNLCLTEKYHIITSSLKLLNKRNELISKCRHENKFVICNFKVI